MTEKQTTENVRENVIEIPEIVRKFVLDFQQAIKDQNVYQIAQFYDNHWNKLTEKYYKQSEWPAPEAITPIVNNGS
jgi:translation initiation factor 3 subunit L